MPTKTSARTKASGDLVALVVRQWSREVPEGHLPTISESLALLSDDEIWWRPNDASNSVGNLILHLCGNVRQWILASIGGEPDRRDRDGEFAARGGRTKAELAETLKTTVESALKIIGALAPERLMERRTIQGYDVYILEAVYTVVEHFSTHTGQIIFATKMLTGADLGFYRHLQSGGAHGNATP